MCRAVAGVNEAYGIMRLPPTEVHTGQILQKRIILDNCGKRGYVRIIVADTVAETVADTATMADTVAETALHQHGHIFIVVSHYCSRIALNPSSKLSVTTC